MARPSFDAIIQRLKAILLHGRAGAAATASAPAGAAAEWMPSGRLLEAALRANLGFAASPPGGAGAEAPLSQLGPGRRPQGAESGGAPASTRSGTLSPASQASGGGGGRGGEARLQPPPTQPRHRRAKSEAAALAALRGPRGNADLEIAELIREDSGALLGPSSSGVIFGSGGGGAGQGAAAAAAAGSQADWYASGAGGALRPLPAPLTSPFAAAAGFDDIGSAGADSMQSGGEEDEYEQEEEEEEGEGEGDEYEQEEEEGDGEGEEGEGKEGEGIRDAAAAAGSSGAPKDRAVGIGAGAPSVEAGPANSSEPEAAVVRGRSRGRSLRGGKAPSRRRGCGGEAGEAPGAAAGEDPLQRRPSRRDRRRAAKQEKAAASRARRFVPGTATGAPEEMVSPFAQAAPR
jgi:hypothetical protein